MGFHLSEWDEAVGELSFRLVGLRNFDEAVDDVFRELEARGEGERLTELCPFFGKLWPAARGLARQLARLGAAGLQGRTCLEVGCGLALPSLVAARLGAVVTATDAHPEVPAFLARNLALNALAVTYRAADWRTPPPDLGRFDLVTASDVLYDREHPLVLAAFVGAHLAPGGRVLLADPGRAWLQDFVTLVEAQGFRTDVRIERVPDGEGGMVAAEAKDVFVLELAQSSPAAPDLRGSAAGTDVTRQSSSRSAVSCRPQTQPESSPA